MMTLHQSSSLAVIDEEDMMKVHHHLIHYDG